MNMLNMTAPLEMGICIGDPERMIGFYQNVLGFELISDLEVPPEKSGPAGFSRGGYRIIRLQTSRGERIKLVHPTSEPEDRSTGGEVLSRKGNVYLTFIVEDLKTTVARIRSSGAPVRTEGEIVEVREGVFLSILDDPEGNHLEFVEYRNLADYRRDLD